MVDVMESRGELAVNYATTSSPSSTPRHPNPAGFTAVFVTPPSYTEVITNLPPRYTEDDTGPPPSYTEAVVDRPPSYNDLFPPTTSQQQGTVYGFRNGGATF
jgi:hypothetical protein